MREPVVTSEVADVLNGVLVPPFLSDVFSVSLHGCTIDAIFAPNFFWWKSARIAPLLFCMFVDRKFAFTAHASTI